MLSFDLTPDQEDFRTILRKFAVERLQPGYIERAKSDSYDLRLHREVADLGILGIGLPVEYGGTGVDDFISLGLASELIGYGDVSLAGAPAMTGLMGRVLAEQGTPEAKERWLRPLINGEVILAIALTEPEAGSDAASLRMTATKVDGGYLLNGEKTSVSWAQHAQGIIVYAREPGSTGSKGISSFVVDMASEGITLGTFNDMGLLPVGRGWVNFDDVFIPDSALLGEPGRGLSQVLGSFDYSRVTIALQCLGAARASLDELSRYVVDRKTFGKPLAAYQGVSLKIAEHYTYVEAATLKCYQTLWLREQGRPHTADAAMCKWWGPRVAVDALESAVTLFGHVAWSDEMPVQARLRDVMAFLIADGTAEIQKLIIAREYIGREVLDRS